MIPASEKIITTLELVNTDPKTLTPFGHKIFNAGIKDCLRLKLVDYDSCSNTGYILTNLGRQVMKAE